MKSLLYEEYPSPSNTKANSARHFLPVAEDRLASAGILNLQIIPFESFLKAIKSPSSGGTKRLAAVERGIFSAPRRLASRRLASRRSAPQRVAAERSAPRRLAVERLASRRLASRRVAPVRSA